MRFLNRNSQQIKTTAKSDWAVVKGCETRRQNKQAKLPDNEARIMKRG